MQVLVASALVALALLATPPAVVAQQQTGAGKRACEAGQLRVAGGCATRARARRRVLAIARRAMRDLGLKATLLRIDTRRRPLLAAGLGRSMAGVPAHRRMRFRIGSIAIPYLVTVLLQLQDEGLLSLDDRLSEYLPGLPEADRVTLRMLANNTSGYNDWIQGNQDFVDLLYADVFKQWTPAELLRHAFARGPACEPGACFSYAHTNYALISRVLQKVTGRAAGRLIRARVLRPLGLRSVAISRLPAMRGPVLHSYSADRGVYEDATFWSPSWTIGAGTVMSATIGDVARSARAIGNGALISRRASRERFAPTTAGLPPMTRELYYGLGIVVANGWRLQNPVLNGYTGVMAYLPARRLSIAIATTQRPRGAAADRNYSIVLLNRLAAYLSPGRLPGVPG